MGLGIPGIDGGQVKEALKAVPTMGEQIASIASAVAETNALLRLQNELLGSIASALHQQAA